MKITIKQAIGENSEKTIKTGNILGTGKRGKKR